MKEKIEIAYPNLIQLYEDGFKKGQDKTFIVYQRINGTREEYTFNQIVGESKALDIKLKNAGLKKGDRIAVISTMRPLWYALTYTCIRQGYIMTCIDPGVPTNQLQQMLLETETKAVFTSLKVVHIPNELDEFIPVYSIDRGFPLISKCKRINFFLSDSTPINEKTNFIIYSSGTTGEKRKAVLINEKTLSYAYQMATDTNTGVYKNTPVFAPNDVDLMMFPPYHIAGLLKTLYDLICNTKVIILERLTPNGLVSALQDLKPDCISTVPAMISSLYKKIVAGYSSSKFKKMAVETNIKINGNLRRKYGIKVPSPLFKAINNQAFGGNLKTIVTGASPIEPVANKFLLDMGIDVIMAYGLTELGAPIACTGQGYYPGTTGRVVKHADDIDIRIVNKDEANRGEVEILSPLRYLTYLDPKDNEGCFTADGYFKTGDLGYFDENNALVICGRIKESIVLRNGEKLLPEEIESKYQNMDSVKDVAAFKIPGEGGCDDFAIAITNDHEIGIPDEALKVRVYDRAEKLPPMYRPKDVYVVKEFPYSSSHKIQRFRLTEMATLGNDAPITDASMVPVDEDETTAELRKMLIEVGGASWKTEKLTQGLLLNLDSLSTVNLYVAIQNKWQIDLFQFSTQPETFGELLDTIKNFNDLGKGDRPELDLSKYPKKANSVAQKISWGAETMLNKVWHVKAYGLENLPEDTNYLICPNHRTNIDPVFIGGVLPGKILKKTCMVGRSSIVDNKIFSKLVITQNFIPIDKTGNSVQTLNRCEELLNEGWNVLIFPEGVNVENNTKLFKLKEGPARLSIATGKPIIPVHMTGVAHTDTEIKRFKLPSIKSRIVFKFGKPIYPGNMNPQELNKVLAQKIEELD